MPNKKNNGNSLLCNQSPWDNNPNSVWLGSTLTLNRNLEKFKFPLKLESDKRQQIISLLNRDLINSDQLKNAELFKAEDLPPTQKEFLVEHFLSHVDFQQTQKGEAFVLDETGEFLAALNLKDHLMLKVIDVREELEKAWEKLSKVEASVNRSVSFAYSPKFGFLTADPTQCGTGLIIYIFLHLPGLIHTNRLEEVLKKTRDEGLERTGLQGDPQEMVGDIVAFHNNYTLGVTEESIISSLRNLATKLIVEEKSARVHIKDEPQQELSNLKDMVSRAFAILLHSYQIEAIEALQAVSLIKLGLELEWLKGITSQKLNKLFFDCRRAHLLCHYGEKISPENLPHKRAEYIHQELKGLTLLI